MTYKSLAMLLEMVAGMQRDLGLADSLPIERDIVALIGMYMQDGHQYVKTEMLINHPLIKNTPKATFHRALRSLISRGIICYADGYKAGRYVLTDIA